jgi:uncharacterized protein YxjI
VYDSDGLIVYRVDNYDSRCRDNICLMDLRGNIVVNILKKVRRGRESVFSLYLRN